VPGDALVAEDVLQCADVPAIHHLGPDLFQHLPFDALESGLAELDATAKWPIEGLIVGLVIPTENEDPTGVENYTDSGGRTTRSSMLTGTEPFS